MLNILELVAADREPMLRQSTWTRHTGKRRAITRIAQYHVEPRRLPFRSAINTLPSMNPHTQNRAKLEARVELDNCFCARPPLLSQRGVRREPLRLLLVFSDAENEETADYYDDDLYNAEVPVASVGKAAKACPTLGWLMAFYWVIRCCDWSVLSNRTSGASISSVLSIASVPVVVKNASG